MSENVEVVESEVVDSVQEYGDEDYIVTFRKPYVFEGDKYSEIDFSGLEHLTAADMIAANKVMERGGSFSVLPEMSLEYACIISAKATKLPIEFFKNLPPKEAIKVKNRITNFIYG